MANQSCRYSAVTAFGVIVALLGIGMMACGIVDIVTPNYNSYIAEGIWGGLYVLVTGIVGIAGGATRSRGAIIAFMVLAILICTVFAAPVTIISFSAAANDYLCWQGWTSNMGWSAQSVIQQGLSDMQSMGQDMSNMLDMAASMNPYPYSSAACQEGMQVNWALAAMTIIAFIAAIIAASTACCAVCACCGAYQNATGVYPFGGTSVMVIQQPQKYPPQYPPQYPQSVQYQYPQAAALAPKAPPAPPVIPTVPAAAVAPEAAAAVTYNESAVSADQQAPPIAAQA